MSVDAKAVFSCSGFPMDSIPLEIHTLIREHVHDYLADFSLTVIGTCVSDGAAHVGVEYNISEAEALGVKIFELRDHWAFEGQYLTTLMVEHPEVFVVPVPEPAHVPVPEAAHDVPSALPGSAPVHAPAPAPVQPKAPSAPASSPLFASPNRRLVERVFRTVTQDPPPGLQGLPQTPVLPGADPDAKLDKVLHSLDALTTFIKSEVVTRTHLDKYHQEQLEMIDKRVVQATEPLLMEIAGLKDRLGAVEANRFDIGSGGARNRSASEKPRATDPAFKTIVFKGIPVNMSADERLNAIDGFMKQHFSGVRVRDVGNFYKGAFPNGRSLTRAAYVELSNADVRREVLEKIGGVKGQPAKIKCFLGGVEVRVRKALTEQAIQRFRIAPRGRCDQGGRPVHRQDAEDRVGWRAWRHR